VPRDVDQGLVERCEAYAARARAGHFFSHATAARIHGLPVGGDARSEPLDVMVVLPDRAPRMRGVTGHHTTVGGVRVERRGNLVLTDVPSTIRLLGGSTELDALVAVIDRAITPRDPLCSVDELRRQSVEHPGERRVRRLREALELARAGSESPQETRLRLVLHRAGLPEPQLNVDIRDSRGRFVARGDLVYRDQRVVVEYDGEQHRLDRGQYVRDVDRLEDLRREGWTVIRVLAQHLGEPQSVARRVRAALGS
jgi:very-short-patch-repair endonuclease